MLLDPFDNFVHRYLCQKHALECVNKLAFFFTLTMILSISVIVVHESYAQSVIPPRHQWGQIDDIDDLMCNDGLVLLQKSNGAPACVLPSTYVKLVDRGYGMYDSSLIMKHPTMMSILMENMVENETLMMHWHNMMLNDPVMIKNTMNDWVSLMKNNTDYLQNVMGPMTLDPKLSEKMIEYMKNHSQMESTLKQNHAWMDSVHKPNMGSDMGHGMNGDMHQDKDKEMNHEMCQWCPDYEMHMMPEHSMKLANSDRVMDMMHHMWINKEMAQDMHEFMIENPSHMANMQEQMMGPILSHMMDDPELRQQMIEMMLQNQDFMNSIRHENSTN